jgi:hypothetical protein
VAEGEQALKILRSAVFAVAGLAGLPAVATAAPSILGPNGYLFTPDGNTTPGGCVVFGIHHAEGDPQSITRPGLPPHVVVKRPNVNAFNFNLGLGNRVELGFSRVSTAEKRFILVGPGAGREAGGQHWLLNGKFALLPPKSPFHLVAGMIDALDSIDRTPYVYGSLNIGQYLPRFALVPRRIQLGAGWATGMIDGPFVNAGIPISPNFELMFEWLDNDLLGVYSAGRQFNAGARLRLGRIPGLAIDIGTTDFSRPAFGVSYSICRKRHHRKPAQEEGVFPPAPGSEPKPAPTSPGAPKTAPIPGGQGGSASGLGPGAGLFRTPR